MVIRDCKLLGRRISQFYYSQVPKPQNEKQNKIKKKKNSNKFLK